MPYYYYYFDPTYVLVLIGAVFCLITSAWVNSSMKSIMEYAMPEV